MWPGAYSNYSGKPDEAKNMVSSNTISLLASFYNSDSTLKYSIW